jgi:hypothetical protein
MSESPAEQWVPAAPAPATAASYSAPSTIGRDELYGEISIPTEMAKALC